MDALTATSFHLRAIIASVLPKEILLLLWGMSVMRKYFGNLMELQLFFLLAVSSKIFVIEITLSISLRLIP